MLVVLLPSTGMTQTPEISSGVAWLHANQNTSGSWGGPALTEFRDTTVVVDILNKLRETGTEYYDGINFINNYAPPNSDYLARKAYVLAQDGSDVTQLINNLLSSQNPKEQDNARYNYPEGGWGAAQGYGTNNLDTILALDALNAAGLAGGLSVSNEPIAPGENDQFQFDLPANAASLTVTITGLSGAIDFRIKQGSPPTLADGYYHLTGAPTNLSGLSVNPGTNYIRIDSAVNSVYSFEVSYVVGGFDTKSLFTPANYLMAAQNPDGGWGMSRGSVSNIYMTARVLITLEGYAAFFDVATNINNGIAWLKTQQNPDGGFGAGGSSAYETALAYTAMANIDLSSTEAQNALVYILAGQAVDGSWNANAYDIAVSLLAIRTSIRLLDTDGDTVPDVDDNCPDDINVDQTNTDGDIWGDVCDNDDDNDGLLDSYEVYITGTDPLLFDTDGDGNSDFATNPFLVDTDGDGISNLQEDFDFDGKSNVEEVALGTDPLSPDVDLTTGFNFFSYPVQVPANYSAYDLLLNLGTDTEVEKVQRFNSVTGFYETASYVSGIPSGVDFPIQSGEGYVVYMLQPKSLSFTGNIVCPQYNLSAGLNIIGVPCFSPTFFSFDMLAHIGTDTEISSVQRFNAETGEFQTTGYLNGQAIGSFFTFNNGEGYMVHMYQVKTGILSPIVPPTAVITSPADGSTVFSSPITVSGTIDDPTAVVMINGVNAAVGGGTFTANGISVAGGANTVAVDAMSANNLMGSDSITVTLDLSVNYTIPLGGSVNDLRIFTAASSVLDQVVFYTEIQRNLPAGVVYTTTGVSRISATEMQINFQLDVQVSAVSGIYDFEVEYGLLDLNRNPLGPLTGNLFNFRIQITP